MYQPPSSSLIPKEQRQLLRSKDGIKPKIQVEYTYPNNKKKIVFIESVNNHTLQEKDSDGKTISVCDVVFTYDIRPTHPTNNEDVKQQLNEVMTDQAHYRENDDYIENYDYIEEIFEFIIQSNKQKVVPFLSALTDNILLDLSNYILFILGQIDDSTSNDTSSSNEDKISFNEFKKVLKTELNKRNLDLDTSF